MPKIRIREIDNTSNEITSEYPTGIFVKVITGTDVKKEIVDKPVELTQSNFSSYDNFIETSPKYNFISQCVNYGATVYIASRYSVAYNYLKDRNQYDIKFLLVNRDEDEHSDTLDPSAFTGESLDNDSDLLLAGMIARKRKDACIIVGLNSLQENDTPAITTYTKADGTSITEDQYNGLSEEDRKTVTIITIPKINGIKAYKDFAKQKLYGADIPTKFAEDSFFTGASKIGAGEVRQPDEPQTDTFGRYMIMMYGSELSGDVTYTPEECFVIAYLTSLYQGNSPWLAVAGSRRGEILGISSAHEIREDDIDVIQPNTSESADDEQIAINPICNVKPYGVRIWGNRTAVPAPTTGLVASSFANVRLLLCELKKSLYNASRKYQFEQNSDILWVNFKSEVTPLLDRMVSGYGIASYRWIKERVVGERAKFKARLQIIPIEAVEDFDLSIEMTDTLEVAE